MRSSLCRKWRTHCARSSSRLRSAPRCRFTASRRPARWKPDEARRDRRRRRARRRHRPHGARPPEDHPGAAPDRRADQRGQQARRRRHDRAQAYLQQHAGDAHYLRDHGDFAPHQSHHRQEPRSATRISRRSRCSSDEYIGFLVQDGFAAARPARICSTRSGPTPTRCRSASPRPPATPTTSRPRWPRRPRAPT